MKKEILIACDHAGVALKDLVKQHFNQTIEFTDFGTNSTESCDYPDFVHPLAKNINQNPEQLGILVCGSANGVAMTANKYENVRAAICWEKSLAELARQHNNANVVCLPARFIDTETALEIIESFLSTDFEGGRHERRVAKMKI